MRAVFVARFRVGAAEPRPPAAHLSYLKGLTTLDQPLLPAPFNARMRNSRLSVCSGPSSRNAFRMNASSRDLELSSSGYVS